MKEFRHDIKELVDTMPGMNKTEIPSDVLGSYTGIDLDNDRPVQDADDL